DPRRCVDQRRHHSLQGEPVLLDHSGVQRRRTYPNNLRYKDLRAARMGPTKREYALSDYLRKLPHIRVRIAPIPAVAANRCTGNRGTEPTDNRAPIRVLGAECGCSSGQKPTDRRAQPEQDDDFNHNRLPTRSTPGGSLIATADSITRRAAGEKP